MRKPCAGRICGNDALIRWQGGWWCAACSFRKWGAAVGTMSAVAIHEASRPLPFRVGRGDGVGAPSGAVPVLGGGPDTAASVPAPEPSPTLRGLAEAALADGWSLTRLEAELIFHGVA